MKEISNIGFPQVLICIYSTKLKITLLKLETKLLFVILERYLFFKLFTLLNIDYATIAPYFINNSYEELC